MHRFVKIGRHVRFSIIYYYGGIVQHFLPELIPQLRRINHPIHIQGIVLTKSPRVQIHHNSCFRMIRMILHYFIKQFLMLFWWDKFKLCISYFCISVKCFVNTIFTCTIRNFRSIELDSLFIRGVFRLQYPTYIFNNGVGRQCFPLLLVIIVVSKAVAVAACIFLLGIIGDNHFHLRCR